ncbi:MAG: Na+:solute symporter [Calditrichaeota bacterium]|nr:Na+:solute symporter [Calditrichota bacterium]
MKLSAIDIGIILAYFAVTIIIGFYVSKRASKNLDSYFLGGKTLPWYVLGVSNASGMFDITGTMWLVYACVVYGLKSVWLPWLWPVFNQIFMMVFLSIWLRRSNVLTGAAWLATRFGKGRDTELAHISVVVFALVSAVGFLAYAFKGIGKFAAIFLPWDISPDMYALIIMGLTAMYAVKGGMFSVVITEVMQFVIMTLASVAVGIIAIMRVSPDMLAKVIPAGWKSLWFGWQLDLNWTGILDSVNDKIAQDGYSLFAVFFMMMLFKGVLVSLAGPAPNYDMQRVLATKSPREAGLMSGFVNVVLLFPRYLMVMGFTILTLVFLKPELQAMGTNIDFEAILPLAITKFIPVGLMGILLAGLLAAFMSTFAATLNAAPAYIVNDIYKRYFNANAEPRKYVYMSYVASLLVLVVGIAFGFVVESINQVMLWIVSALWGGYTAANVLKWYWWRFNGYGYFWGMVSGIAAALTVPRIFPNLSELNAFPIILIVSTAGSFLGCLFTKPTEESVLKKFYTSVRPWGFWKPIYEKVIQENHDFKKNTDFKRDTFNIAIGMIWQVTLTVLPMFFVIKETKGIIISTIVLGITSVILKKNWYDKLQND